MRTFHYEIPLSGELPTSTTGMSDFTYYLENGLKDGPDCLMAYCIFPSDSDVLESVSLKGKNGQFTSLSLFTYTKLYEGSENDLKNCVAENLAMAELGLDKLTELVRLTARLTENMEEQFSSIEDH